MAINTHNKVTIQHRNCQVFFVNGKLIGVTVASTGLGSPGKPVEIHLRTLEELEHLSNEIQQALKEALDYRDNKEKIMQKFIETTLGLEDKSFAEQIAQESNQDF